MSFMVDDLPVSNRCPGIGCGEPMMLRGWGRGGDTCEATRENHTVCAAESGFPPPTCLKSGCTPVFFLMIGEAAPVLSHGGGTTTVGISHIQLAVGCAYCRSAPGFRLGIGNRGGLKCDGRGGASMESASVPYLDRRKNSGA